MSTARLYGYIGINPKCRHIYLLTKSRQFMGICPWRVNQVCDGKTVTRVFHMSKRLPTSECNDALGSQRASKIVEKVSVGD